MNLGFQPTFWQELASERAAVSRSPYYPRWNGRCPASQLGLIGIVLARLGEGQPVEFEELEIPRRSKDLFHEEEDSVTDPMGIAVSAGALEDDGSGYMVGVEHKDSFRTDTPGDRGMVVDLELEGEASSVTLDDHWQPVSPDNSYQLVKLTLSERSLDLVVADAPNSVTQFLQPLPVFFLKIRYFSGTHRFTSSMFKVSPSLHFLFLGVNVYPALSCRAWKFIPDFRLLIPFILIGSGFLC